MNLSALFNSVPQKPKLVEYESGNKLWYLKSKLHREDGPAVEYANGNKFWYLNDKRHREDGPAIELADGTKEWWLNDKQVDQLVFWVTTKERQKA